MINDIANFFESIFSPVVSVLAYALEFFHGLGLEWWLSIAALTIVVRMILFPLTIKQVRSMRAMQDLRPELEKIRGQYSNNRQRQQEEMMKLYQERNINPLGGCLPILLQMPIFIGIFYVIRQFGGYGDVEGTKPSFQDGGILWFTNLSEMDPYLILPVVSALTMLAATEITAKNLEPQQRWIMRILPIGITFFLWSFPAGLFVYWITSNVVTFVQNYAIYNYGPGKKSATEPSKPDSGDKGGGKGSEELSTNGSSHPTAQAAKVAKRKRRKKKK
ncbi:MAG: membrane protein insertase YidC [Rubrobacter sp.]|jgi:YidC/Oxa1 family membrane protein insertase|nr:membrane protein insertase YidC [Rubrobacter sp.]